MSLERFLQELQDGAREVTHAGLLRLSNLGPEEAVLLRQQWPSITPARRRTIIDRVVLMAEDNVEVDFTTLLRLCLEDPDEEVRQKAIGGLWECEDRSLIPSLIKLLEHDSSWNVRAAAAMGLGRFALLSMNGKLLTKDEERVKGALLGVIRDSRHPLEIRRRAIEAVAPFNTPEINEYIRWAYENGGPTLRCSALYAMGRSCNPQWFPLILKELKAEEPALRYEAANACGEMGIREAIPHLAPLVRDEDTQVQLAAIQALGHIGGRQARRLLQAQLSSADVTVEDAVHEALRRMDVEDDPLIP